MSFQSIELTGALIKEDNGSGYSLSQAFPKRRFHDEVLYLVSYNGVMLDNSTVTSIVRSSNQPLPGPPRRGQPPKPAEERASEWIQLRVTKGQKRAYERAAGVKPVSEWAKGLLDAATQD